MAATSDRCCVFAYPPSSSVPGKPNTSLYSGGPSPPAIVGAMAGPWLPAQCPHHMMAKGTLRRRAHRASQGHPAPKVGFNVAAPQADLWQTLFSMWPSSSPSPKPGKNSSADIGPTVSLFSLLSFCLHSLGRTHTLPVLQTGHALSYSWPLPAHSFSPDSSYTCLCSLWWGHLQLSCPGSVAEV